MSNKVLTLKGRRWFQRSAGNTYYSAVAIYNGKVIKQIDYAYGYGEQWLDELTKDLTVCQLQRGDRQVPWKYLNDLREAGVHVETDCTDVQRKRDLQF